MNLLRWQPTYDLPVFDTDRELYTDKYYFRDIATKLPHDTSFLRTARLTVSEGTADLSEVLSLAEGEFQKVALFTGAAIIGHTFGLYPKQGKWDATGLVPKGYVLSTEVDIVDTTPLSEENESYIRSGCRFYEETGGMLTDMSTEQFKTGTSRRLAAVSISGAWLLDIEPLLK